MARPEEGEKRVAGKRRVQEVKNAVSAVPSAEKTDATAVPRRMFLVLTVTIIRHESMYL